MNSDPASASVPDWISFLASASVTAGDELDLTGLEPGDILLVQTRHTLYALQIVRGRDAILRCDRPDRPSGAARIAGCTFGASSSIKPDRLFCDGNLELTLDAGRLTHRTTAIREIRLVRRASGDEPAPSQGQT